MGIESELFAIDRDLASFSATRPKVDDWMTQANLSSARQLRNLVHEAWMPHRRGVVARFHEGAVAGHTAPAYQVLRTAYEFNDAVVAVSNRMLEKPYAVINDAVRKKLGLLMRPVMAGSVELDLVCPIPGVDEDMTLPEQVTGQSLLPDLENLQSQNSIALQRVLDVLRLTANGTTRDALADRADDVGPDGWRKLARLAGRCVDADFTIDFWSRTEPNEWFAFAPSHAAALKTFIKERSLTATNVEYEGIWQTASSVRTWFDLMTNTGHRISGNVPQDLLVDSMSLLDKKVIAVVREETDSENENQVIKRTLVSLEPKTSSEE
ncbi:hypothetical protein [Rhodococcus rhodochrous]|uniref:hypothetical protein n=1 Tax=Rhodococcus rhodochrous TaxID=1829 RepID=UPI00035F495F|nr:hypothetical protein [Rhodococcus rhodochrous]